MEPHNPSSNPDHELIREFVITWGEMASSWGINRTMAQIHALLYIVDHPLDTDAIMEELEVSRGNANMNIRNLMQWGLVHKIHYPGQRKDFFTAEKDVWATAATIIQERQQKEIEPLKKNLQRLLDRLKEQNREESPNELQTKVEALVQFMDIFEGFTESLLPYVNEKNIDSIQRISKIARMGRKSKSIPHPDGGKKD